ncbi:MAG: hypothetical protein H0T92_19360 [Pyrinomonadaceae bacterium]|nr:hypothetical protein [Pyrinomonadaceae bacterium]
MKKQHFFTIIFALSLAVGASAQNNPTPATPAPQSGGTAGAVPRSTAFDLEEYGVQIAPDPRLIVVMAALEAAGFDPVPAGRKPSLFRSEVKRRGENLDPSLRERLRRFYEGHKLPSPATPAEQAARYISLALALGPGPTFEAPLRSDDLPGGLLEVLDFATLVRDFYQKSGMDQQLPAYIQTHEAEANRLRRPTAEMIRAVLSYLHTRPIITITERVPVARNTNQKSSSQKKKGQQAFTMRERARRFHVVPDLLAAPGTINFRIIGDDYYLILPENSNVTSTEVRRAYLQFVVDPLVARFSREIAARRVHIKQLIDERARPTAATAEASSSTSPDVFQAVARSVVAAAEARMTEAARRGSLARDTSVRLQNAKEDAARASIIKEAQAARTGVEDNLVAQLADAEDRGAVLAFYFADQLRGMETSGFDIANFFADMIASIDIAREKKRFEENREARERAQAAARRNTQATNQATENRAAAQPGAARRTALINSLSEAENLLRAKNYTEAEKGLLALMQQYQGEPRIFFALGQAASLAAQDAFDEDLQSRRLNQALAHYRDAVRMATPDTEDDRALVSRAHVAMGRILAFQDKPAEAIREFDAAIQFGEVPGGAFSEAVAAKQKLAPSK